MLLLEDKKTLKLDPPMPKILCSSAAYNDSAVVIRMDLPNQKESVVHLSSKGEILF